MTVAEKLRGWALDMRAMLEPCDGRAVSMTFQSGDVVMYELGVGLRYETAGGDVLEVPESALDEERWELTASAASLVGGSR